MIWPLPSKRTLSLFGILLGGGLLSISFPWIGPLLLAADALILLFMATDGLLIRRVGDFQITREVPLRAGIGSAFEYQLLITPPKGGVLQLKVKESWPPLSQGQASFELAFAPGGVCQKIDRTIYHPKREILKLGAVYLRFKSPLGFWTQQKRINLAHEIKITPKLSAPGDALKALQLAGFEGLRQSMDRGQGSDFESLRPYLPGDALKSIDWNAFARTGRPITKLFTVEKNWDVILAMDVGRLMGSEYKGLQKLDYTLEALLAFSHGGIVLGDKIGLLAFDDDIRLFVPPGPGHGQVARVVDAASGLKSSIRATSFRRALSFLATHHQKRCLLVIFTDFIDQDTARPMVEAMAQLSKQHLCLFVAVSDPSLKLTLEKQATTTDELYEKWVALDLTSERKRVLRSLERMGIEVLDLPPDHLVGPILNAYLRLRANLPG